MMVEPQTTALDERNICQNIVLGHGDKTVLEILRVGECPGIRLDNAGTEQKRSAGKSIKIRTCD